jgi:hypothetical protein
MFSMGISEDPKMEVLYHIRQYFLGISGDIPLPPIVLGSCCMAIDYITMINNH